MSAPNKPKPIFSPSAREKGDFQAPPVLVEDGDFTIFYGSLSKGISYYLIGILNERYYSYKIGDVAKFEKLKERFEDRGGRFKQNLATNPFIWWDVLPTNLGIPDYESRPFGEFYYGGFGGRSYKTSNGGLLDFAKGVGVYTKGY